MSNSSQGFTLLELMVTIAMVLILAAIAVPGVSSMVQTNAVSSYANMISTSLMLAKSEASKRSAVVNFVPEINWSDGWNVEDSGGTVIRRFDGIPAAYTVSTSATSLGFRNDGSITTSAAYTVKLQPATGCTADLVREIKVTLTGTVSVSSGGTCS
ncbi:GspH/FimT family pseudopilin [uncultured Tolumonas sp.]|uniref:GspH/FimT family pseudopilin n=1 Tax=uncultured Tolumonas sp. TaxID=263765 RepID=UPI002A0A3311|nr:GspH/FimT family pseudopilin [uncultured Tolumonas sp.]